VEIVDVGTRVYERDKEAGGTLLGSALALRLPVLRAVHPAARRTCGRVRQAVRWIGDRGDGRTHRDAGQLRRRRLRAECNTPWIALVVGLVGTTGWSLTRALVLSSALAWRLGGRQHTPIRAIGIVMGLVGLIAVHLVLWLIPRRVPAVERYFALDHVADGEPESPPPSGLPGVDRP
jgi:hypothetical protein